MNASGCVTEYAVYLSRMKRMITDDFEYGVVALNEDGCGRRRKPNALVVAWQMSCTPVPRVFKVRVWNPAQITSITTI